ncbi:MAG: cytochrome C oxidase Cbb3, partial [Gammaproteobacteria bacterium]|nr:cytochrome C oxidase Cbb3 [Gammaproteobacteria bacterium]
MNPVWRIALILSVSPVLLPADIYAVEPSVAVKLYAQHCASCHGADRLGGIGPALLPENLGRIKRDEAIA